MRIKQLISFLLVILYGVILSHDFMPHHHHDFPKEVCQHQHHSDDHCHHHQHHNGCEHSDDCNFPYHQHNLAEAGVYLNNSKVDVKVEINFTPKTILLNKEELTSFYCEHKFQEFVPFVYKGPDLGSSALRAPPVS